MFIHNFNPVIFNFGVIEIRWYSLAYILGILIGWWLAKEIIKIKIISKNIVFDIRKFDDLISYIVIAIILGGRFGYIIFYNFNYYLSNPLDIFKVWEGGMSFHGALIGIIIATYIFAKKLGLSPLFFLDVISSVAPIGLFFGRIANFINSELYGHETSLPWSVVFPLIDEVPRHPSQLYEALLEGVLLFIILMPVIFNKKIKTGFCSGLFLILYGLVRIVGEQFRVPDIQIGYFFNLFSMGAILSFTMIVFGLLIIIKIKKNDTSI